MSASADLESDDWVARGCTNGVPMGQDLPAMPAGALGPTIMVWAMKDTQSRNLDRIQIVKGWYQDGQPREQIYTVVWSDRR